MHKPAVSSAPMTPNYASALVQRYMRSSVADADGGDSSESPFSARSRSPSLSPSSQHASKAASPPSRRSSTAQRASSLIRAAAFSDDEEDGRPAARAAARQHSSRASTAAPAQPRRSTASASAAQHHSQPAAASRSRSTIHAKLLQQQHQQQRLSTLGSRESSPTAVLRPSSIAATSPSKADGLAAARRISSPPSIHTTGAAAAEAARNSIAPEHRRSSHAGASLGRQAVPSLMLGDLPPGWQSASLGNSSPEPVASYHHKVHDSSIHADAASISQSRRPTVSLASWQPDMRSSSSSMHARSPVPPKHKAPPPGALSPRSHSMLAIQRHMQEHQQHGHNEQQQLGRLSVQQDDLMAQQLRDITQSAAAAIARARSTSAAAAAVPQLHSAAAAAQVSGARRSSLGGESQLLLIHEHASQAVKHRQQQQQQNYRLDRSSSPPNSPGLPPPDAALAREAVQRLSSPNPGAARLSNSLAARAQNPEGGDSDSDDDALRDVLGYGDGRPPAARSKRRARKQEQQQQQEGFEDGRQMQSQGLMGDHSRLQFAAEPTLLNAAGVNDNARHRQSSRRMSAAAEISAAALAAASAEAARHSLHDVAPEPVQLASAVLSRRASAALSAGVAAAEAADRSAALAAAAVAAAEAGHLTTGGSGASGSSSSRSKHGTGSDSHGDEDGDRPWQERVHGRSTHGWFPSPERVRKHSSRHSSKSHHLHQHHHDSQRYMQLAPDSDSAGLPYQHLAHEAGGFAPTAAAIASKDYGRWASQQQAKQQQQQAGLPRHRQPVPLFYETQPLPHRSSRNSTAAASKHSGTAARQGLSANFGPGCSTATAEAKAAATAAAGDRLLKQLVKEGIEQSPVTTGGSGRRAQRRNTTSSSDEGSSSSNSSSHGGSDAGDRARRQMHPHDRMQELQQQMQRQMLQQQHEVQQKHPDVMLQRETLAAARRAASPVRMRRCSSPEVADAAISAAAASAAAARVAAQQRQKKQQSTAAPGRDWSSFHSASSTQHTPARLTSSSRRRGGRKYEDPESTEEQQHRARLQELLEGKAGPSTGGFATASATPAAPLLVRTPANRRYSRPTSSPSTTSATRRSSSVSAAAAGVASSSWQYRSVSVGRQRQQQQPLLSSNALGNSFARSAVTGTVPDISSKNVSPPRDQQGLIGLYSAAAGPAAIHAAAEPAVSRGMGGSSSYYHVQDMGMGSNVPLVRGADAPSAWQRPVSPVRWHDLSRPAAAEVPSVEAARLGAAAAHLHQYQHEQQRLPEQQYQQQQHVDEGLGFLRLSSEQQSRTSPEGFQHPYHHASVMQLHGSADVNANYSRNADKHALQEQQQQQWHYPNSQPFGESMPATWASSAASSPLKQATQALQLEQRWQQQQQEARASSVAPQQQQSQAWGGWALQPRPQSPGLASCSAAELHHQTLQQGVRGAASAGDISSTRALAAHGGGSTAAGAAAAGVATASTDAGLRSRSATPSRDRSTSRNRAALIPVGQLMASLQAFGQQQHHQQEQPPFIPTMVAQDPLQQQQQQPPQQRQQQMEEDVQEAAGQGAAEQLGGESTISFARLPRSSSLGSPNLGLSASEPGSSRSFAGFQPMELPLVTQRDTNYSFVADKAAIPDRRGSRQDHQHQQQQRLKPVFQMPELQHTQQQHQQQQAPSPGPDELGDMLAGVMKSVQGLDSIMSSLVSSAASRSPSAKQQQQCVRHAEREQLGRKATSLPGFDSHAAAPGSEAATHRSVVETAAAAGQLHPMRYEPEDFMLMGSVQPAVRSRAVVDAGTPGSANAASGAAADTFFPVATAAEGGAGSRHQQDAAGSRLSGLSGTGLSPGLRPARSSESPSPAAAVSAAAASVRRAMEELRSSTMAAWQQDLPQHDQLQQQGGNAQVQFFRQAAAAANQRGTGTEGVMAPGEFSTSPTKHSAVVVAAADSRGAQAALGLPDDHQEQEYHQHTSTRGSYSFADSTAARSLFPGANSMNNASMDSKQQAVSTAAAGIQQKELLQKLSRMEGQLFALQQQVLLSQQGEQASNSNQELPVQPLHQALQLSEQQSQQQQQQQEEEEEEEEGEEILPVQQDSTTWEDTALNSAEQATHMADEPMADADAEMAADVEVGHVAASMDGSNTGSPAMHPSIASLAEELVQLQDSLRALLPPDKQGQPSDAHQLHQEEDEQQQQTQQPMTLAGAPMQMAAPGVSSSTGAATPTAAAATAAGSPPKQRGSSPPLITFSPDSRPSSRSGGHLLSLPGLRSSTTSTPDLYQQVDATSTQAAVASAAADTQDWRQVGGHDTIPTAAQSGSMRGGSQMALSVRVAESEDNVRACVAGLQLLQERISQLEEAQIGQQQQKQQEFPEELLLLPTQLQELQASYHLQQQDLRGQLQHLQQQHAELLTQLQDSQAEAADAVAATNADVATKDQLVELSNQLQEQQQQQLQHQQGLIGSLMQQVAEVSSAQQERGQQQELLEQFRMQQQQRESQSCSMQEQLQQVQHQQLLFQQQQKLQQDATAAAEGQQQVLLERLQALESLPQQLRQEWQHELQQQQQQQVEQVAAAGRAAAAAAVEAAAAEIHSLHEQVQQLELKVAQLQTQQQQHLPLLSAAAADTGATAVAGQVASLQDQLQQLNDAIQQMQQQQQQAGKAAESQAFTMGSAADAAAQQSMQAAVQQQQQQELVLLSQRVADITVQLQGCSQAVTVHLPMRLVEVEERVAATAHTCADAVKVIALKHANISAMFQEVQSCQTAANSRLSQLSQQLSTLRAAQGSRRSSSSRTFSMHGPTQSDATSQG